MPDDRAAAARPACPCGAAGHVSLHPTWSRDSASAAALCLMLSHNSMLSVRASASARARAFGAGRAFCRCSGSSPSQPARTGRSRAAR